MPWRGRSRVVVAFALITTLHIVLGELAPKTLALQRTEQMALWVAVPVEIFSRVFRPVHLGDERGGRRRGSPFGIRPARRARREPSDRGARAGASRRAHARGCSRRRSCCSRGGRWSSAQSRPTKSWSRAQSSWRSTRRAAGRGARNRRAAPAHALPGVRRGPGPHPRHARREGPAGARAAGRRRLAVARAAGRRHPGVGERRGGGRGDAREPGADRRAGG